MPDPQPLAFFYQGWQGYHQSLVEAVSGLSTEQLAFWPAPGMRTVGEIVSHIAGGRVDWLSRILRDDAPELVGAVEDLIAGYNPDEDAGRLVEMLETSWRLPEYLLANWTADDLARAYHQPYQGKTYNVSYQWVVWRILSHDIHHGGELALALGTQGIAIPALGDFGGHTTDLEVVVEP